MINVAVMGYGTVGSGVVEVVNTNGARINQRIGEELNIKYVLDLRDFPGDPVQEKIIHDFETIINDDDVQIVVEVIGIFAVFFNRNFGFIKPFTMTRKDLKDFPLFIRNHFPYVTVIFDLKGKISSPEIYIQNVSQSPILLSVRS